MAGSGGSGESVAVLLGKVADQLTGGASGAGMEGRLADQLNQLTTAGREQAQVVLQNTQALLTNTVVHAESSGGSALSTVGKIFTSGLGISPLIRGIIGLFGGGGSKPLPELPVYTPPPAIEFEGTVNGPGSTPQWIRDAGTPVLPEPQPTVQATQQMKSPQPGQQITIQVHAMDSQSFLDHSEDIARAVRAAMLNSNPVNDVVNDL